MATLENVKELREQTGCGIVECKKALEESAGDLEKAITILRKQGKTKATKKANRETREGIVASYVHSNNKLAVLVSLLCETDFVARNERFQELAHEIALHIAAMDPMVVKPEDIDEKMLEKEKEIALEQVKDKPEEIKEKIIDGKLNSFKEERALLTQVFVKDPKKTIQDLINEAIQELGENITVSAFSRLSI